MSNSAILCPDCGSKLATRRRNGNVAFRSPIEPALNGGSVWLVCACGSRKLVENVLPVLLRS